MADARVVHQNIQSPFRVVDLVGGSLAKPFVGYIESDEFRFAFMSSDSSDSFVTAFFVSVSDVNESVGADERFRNGSADARPGPGNQSDFILEAEHG
jgi:hypothetical protein